MCSLYIIILQSYWLWCPPKAGKLQARSMLFHVVTNCRPYTILNHGHIKLSVSGQSSDRTDSPGTPFICLIILTCWSKAALTISNGSSICHRQDFPTGFVWWRQQNTHLFAQAKLGVASMHLKTFPMSNHHIDTGHHSTWKETATTDSRGLTPKCLVFNIIFVEFEWGHCMTLSHVLSTP